MSLTTDCHCDCTICTASELDKGSHDVTNKGTCSVIGDHSRPSNVGDSPYEDDIP